MNEIRSRKEREDAVAARQPTSHIVVAITLTAMLGVIGFLVAGSIARSATQANGTVSLSKTKLGQVLVNSKGHTLYMFAKDKDGKSSCSGSCAKFWPPYLQHGKATAGSGVKASLLGTTKRSNGMQITYNKHPLYSFVLDKKAGQTNGEGNVAFGAKWYAVSAKGTAVVRSSTTNMTTTNPTTSTPYPANPYP
jgi:predicted lipoprotein with Yx(FWY)xxD motif